MIDEINDWALDIFLPIIWLFVPWSGETLKKGKPKVGNIEQSFQKVVKDGIKAYLKKKGAEVTNMEYEHGKTRESGFTRKAQRKGLFSKEETAEENELEYYSRHNFPINEEKIIEVILLNNKNWQYLQP